MFSMIMFLLTAKYFRRISERHEELMLLVMICFMLTIVLDYSIIKIILSN